MTRSLAAVPSIEEVELACLQIVTLWRQVHAFAFDAGGSAGTRSGRGANPTEATALGGLDDGDARLGSRTGLVQMALHLDMAIAAGKGAIRVEQRQGNVATSQTWTVQQAEDVSEEYAVRKRRGQTHARSVGA